MKTKLFILRSILSLFTLVSAVGADNGGWRPLFNGKDLSGWVPVQVAPNTFTVRDGIIVSTGVPTGVMRTDRQYENFELELDWKHIVPQGNAGLFVWSYPITAVGQPFTKSIEVQILDGRNSETHTSHGDIFSIHGARMKPDRPHPKGAERCLPSEWRCKPAGEWNHYRVVCSNGVVKLSVNGKEVSGGSECTPRKGYICLESEGTECHFRNIRLKELPSTNPKPEEIAPEAEGFVSIYNGLNLDGWTTTAPQHWKAKDWVLEYDRTAKPNGPEVNPQLSTQRAYKNFILMLDWYSPKGPSGKNDPEFYVILRGVSIPLTPVRGAKWNRATIRFEGSVVTGSVESERIDPLNESKHPIAMFPFYTAAEGPIVLEPKLSAIQFANIYIKEVK